MPVRALARRGAAFARLLLLVFGPAFFLAVAFAAAAPAFFAGFPVVFLPAEVFIAAVDFFAGDEAVFFTDFFSPFLTRVGFAVFEGLPAAFFFAVRAVLVLPPAAAPSAFNAFLSRATRSFLRSRAEAGTFFRAASSRSFSLVIVLKSGSVMAPSRFN
ncbi:MAG: hypothetical protein JSU88_00860 [Nitrospinaceae bacterium]|nr:MAG: hypothetical protein JSU88_00860 [Nitrospinaceae bacterium]